MSLTKRSLAGNIKLFPARESFVNDIPAGEGKWEPLFTVYPIGFYLILQNHFRLAGVLVRGDDQQPEQERGAGDGVEHGGSAHLHRLRGRRRHRRQRGRQQDLGQGDQECHAGRCVGLTLLRGNSKFIIVFPIFYFSCSLYFLSFFLPHFSLFFSSVCSVNFFPSFYKYFCLFYLFLKSFFLNSQIHFLSLIK